MPSGVTLKMIQLLIVIDTTVCDNKPGSSGDKINDSRGYG
jgi:hypothetical protein